MTVTTSDYGEGKTALMSSVGAGTPVLTELDTGSDLLLVEQKYAGPGVVMENPPVKVTITYDHGDSPRSGLLGHAPFTLLEQAAPVLSTTLMVPVVVVPDGVVNPVADQNHAIFGIGMRSTVSPKLYFPPPLNQTVVIDRAHHHITFGPFTQSQTDNFGLVELALSACPRTPNVPPPDPPSSLLCWNDSGIMVDYRIEGAPQPTQSYATLFDSGASSSFQFDPFPSWFKVTDLNPAGTEGILRNKVTSASVMTTKGPMLVDLTDPIKASQNGAPAGFVNCGNPTFQKYQVLLDQLTGRFGLRPNSP